MRLTYNPSNIWYITIPEVVFTGDFRISMYTTWIGPTIGFDNTEHYIHGAAATVKLNNTTYTQDGVAPPVSERDGLFHYHKVWFERIGNTFTVYRGENKEEVLRTLTVNTGTVKFTQIGRSGTQNQWRGLAWDLKFEDLVDTNSLNNRFYGLHEEVTELSAFDDLNNQNGTYSQERGSDRGGLFEATPTGWRNRELGYLRDMSRYNISEAKVLATFSASVLQSTFDNEKRTLADWEFWKLGAELEFYQFGNGGEYIQDAIDDAPSYISGLLAKGYLPENITAVVHIGGNDVSGSIPYGSNKDTNTNITNMRSRLEQLYTILSEAGFTIVWLPITWRNYGTVPPDSNGSEPFNTNIVEPFLRDIVGATSWDAESQKPKYDFYNFVKDEFALDNGFLQDAVHPSGVGQESIRGKFAEWFSPLYIEDTTAPVVTNNGPATLKITVGDTYTPDFSTNEGTLDISNPVDVNALGTYTVTATATDAAGNVGSATQTVIVEAQVVSSTLRISISGLSTSSQYMKLWDYENETLLFKGQIDFVNDVAEISLNVAVGTVITGDQLGDNPPTTGTGTYGVTV